MDSTRLHLRGLNTTFLAPQDESTFSQETRITTLAKVSDLNLFRVNQNYSDSFRHLYPSQCESFQTNPKQVLHLPWHKYRIGIHSEPIRTIPRSEWFGLILIENLVWINPSSNLFGLKSWFRFGSDSSGWLSRIKSD